MGVFDLMGILLVPGIAAQMQLEFVAAAGPGTSVNDTVLVPADGRFQMMVVPLWRAAYCRVSCE